MTWKILVSAPYMRPVFEAYLLLLQESESPVEMVPPPVKERMSEEKLLEWIGLS